MRVLLVNPSSGNNTFRTVGVFLPPLGLLYVAAAVRQHGYEVAIYDEAVDHRPVDFGRYDVVGIHCNTTRFEQTMALAHRFKAKGAKVVLGGPHPCFDSQAILNSKSVDAIVRGEGERVFVDLLDAWQSGRPEGTIKGVIQVHGETIVDGGPADRITELDSLPMPARDLIDLSHYRRAQLAGMPLASVHTSRGCPYQCRFCASTQLDGAAWRARSAQNVLAEVEHLVFDLGFKAIAFTDDNFTGSVDRVHQICDGILSRGMDIRWWCFCRADTAVRHPEMIGHMARAGAFSVFVGVESPRAEVLDGCHKGIRAEQARQAVSILKSHGIEIWASYILGFPQERRTDIRATIRFARELDTHTAQFTLLTPYPGTVLWDELEGRLLQRSGKLFDGVHMVYRHPHLSRHELQLWHLWAYLSFYFRHMRSIRGFFRFLRNRMNRSATEAPALKSN